MLLDNFKTLLSFYPNDNFIDVAGNSVTKANNLISTNQSPSNGHTFQGVRGYFNYTMTTASNGCTNEQGIYNWLNVVSTTSYNNDYHRHNGFTLFVGSGNRAVTPSDYCLENAVTLLVIGASCIHYADGRTITTRIFYNNTDEDVTINEIGLYIFTTAYTTPIIMIGRKVLQTPVIIPKGEQYTFSYTIDTSRVSFAEADY